MKLICEYCEAEYDETLDVCPNCRAANTNKKKTAESGPRTMEELKTWFYATLGFTKEKTHIFIGEDSNEPAVFGMFRNPDDSDFVVYKNKANGERAIRYKGVDEQYAVNELYQLIQRQAIRNGVALNGSKNPEKITSRRRKDIINNIKGLFILIIFILIFIFFFFLMLNIPHSDSGGSSSSYDSGSSSHDSSSNHSSRGSSRDDNDWDSGDWDSDWGFNIRGTYYAFI